MRFDTGFVFFALFQALGVSAFTPVQGPKTTTDLGATVSSNGADKANLNKQGGYQFQEPGTGTPVSELPTLGDFPVPAYRIEGGGTIRTWKIPMGVERVQMMLETDGRPMKCQIQTWLGPGRTTHTMKIDSENGLETPYRAMLKFKKDAGSGNQVFTIKNIGNFDFPVNIGIRIIDPEENKKIAAITEAVFESQPKRLIQGGATTGGGGSVHTFAVPDDVDRCQILLWAKNTGKKSFKQKIEVLQGPNRVQQDYFLQCGGGSQPFHAIIETPGAGVTVRIQNQKFVEDGLTQCVVVPYPDSPQATLPSQAPDEQWWLYR